MTPESVILQAILDADDQSAFAVDDELRYTAFNRAHADVMRALYGSEIRLGGRQPDYQTVAADREIARQNLERALTGERVVSSISLGGDGARRLHELVHTPQLDPGGAVVGVIVHAHDVTERHAAEAALVAGEDRYESILRASPDDITVTDLAGIIQTASPSAARMVGLASPDELIGRSIVEFLDPEDHETAAANVGRMLRGEIWGPDEYRGVRADGSRFPMEINGDLLRDPAGEPTGMVFIARDVSRRKLLEAQVENERQRYRLLVENMGEAVLLTRPDGTVLAANPAACRMFGRTEEEIRAVGREGLADATDPRLAAAVEERAVKGRVTGELRLLRRDGSAFPAEVASTVYQDHTGGEWASMVIRDLTESRQAEAEIRRLNAELEARIVSRTSQLEAANKELEAFAYSASHDLRAPLRAIGGFTQMVLDDAAERLEPDDVEHLQRARAAAQRMAALMDDLLGLSRVARRDLARRDVDLSALAGEVFAELRAAEPGRRVDCVVAPGMTAAADPDLARVILVNLMGNAWKFTGGHETARIEVGVRDDQGEPVFFVRDDGAGFNERYADHLFGAFQRMHAPGEFEGDGIGLAIVQRLVTRHGGRIWATAEVEKGATFCFTLPRPVAAA